MEPILLSSVGYASKTAIHGVYALGEYLLTGAHPHIADRLEEIDIVNKVAVVEAYLDQLYGKDKKSDQRTRFTKPVQVAVKSVGELIERLHAALATIKVECEYHATRYFHYWRTPDCMLQLQTVERLSALLDQRLALMMQILVLA